MKRLLVTVFASFLSLNSFADLLVCNSTAYEGKYEEMTSNGIAKYKTKEGQTILFSFDHCLVKIGER